MEITKSCGNVFLDLGFKPAIAENLRIRTDLMILLEDYLQQQRLSPPQAAKQLGVREATVKKLLQGEILLVPTLRVGTPPRRSASSGGTGRRAS